MTGIRDLITAVIEGREPPGKLHEYVRQFLQKPDANADALRKALDAAEKMGLDSEVVQQARKLIDEHGQAGDEKTSFNIGDPTRAVDDDSTQRLNPDATRADIGEPTRVADDDPTTVIDPDRTVAAGGGDDHTTLVDPDKTVAAGGDGDRTTLIDPDRTAAVDSDDPFAMTDRTMAPGGGTGKGGEEHGPGSVLKGRFRLEEVIGQGGMGAVYKAVDLLKVEARDRNPYIAVKLLVGDFKEHPEAFIALQRESTKAQRLAHPNIATVYDFDRDGETVYMTMELMEGAELAKYIKKLPAGGLPVEEANKIIEQLCAGLGYAHARSLVHSDFKPGNAFMLDDGTVKLLDFGIARASATKADAEGETTVFDPGELGALTPAYATIEMFEGKDPDPRDDIYALACVAYELYTGQHPFKKMSAVKARDKGLKPAPLEKLTKRQNRALMRGLALLREDRIGSVEEFWDELRPRKDYTWHIAGGATAAAIVLGLLLYNPILDFIHEREHAAILAEVESRDEDRLLAALAQIRELPAERRRTVAERGRDTIMGYFEGQAEDAVDEDAGNYDYPTALSYMDELDRYFPDSAAVAQIRQSIEARLNALINRVDERFTELLEAGDILPREDEEDITDVVAILRQAAPGNPMLSDARLVQRYANLAEAAVEDDAWERADDILEVGLAYAPGEASLLNLHDQVQSELRRMAEAQLVAELRGTLSEARPGLNTISDYRGVRDDLHQLAALRPNDDLVRALLPSMRQAFETELARLTGGGEWGEADALLYDFAQLFEVEYLVDTRSGLTGQQTAAGYDPRADANRVATLERLRGEVEALAGNPAFDDDWARELDTSFKNLVAVLTPDTGWFDALRDEVAQVHISGARERIAANRFSAAAELIDQGEGYHPTLPDFAEQRGALEQAREAFRIAEEQRLLAARIEAEKNRLINQARADDVRQARETFDSLRQELDADDEFIVETAPRALAEAYLRMANRRAEDADYTNAVTLVEQGLEVAPNFGPLLEVLEPYQGYVKRDELMAAASGARAQDIGRLRQQLDEVRAALPGEAAAINRDLVRNLEQRIRAVERTDIPAAHALRDAALQLFPGNQQLTAMTLRPIPRPSEFAPRGLAAIDNRELTRADAILAEARRDSYERDHAEVAAFARALDEAKDEARSYYREFQTLQQRGDLTRAQQYLTAAIDRWRDNADWQETMRQFAGTRAPERADDGSVACTESLAGHGRARRGECFDMPAGQRGPRMVVIPAPAGGQPFAISKFEIAVGDYNTYCEQSGNCQPRSGSAALPVTNISIQQAERYIAWLADTTGKSYRLPTDAEWTHAAGGGGNPGSRDDFNCRVTLGGSVIKGQSLVNITTGTANGYGLTNHVGNAQEWVRTGGTLMARGGHHQDALSNCEIGLSRSHDGSADEVTGFRVVRGLD